MLGPILGAVTGLGSALLGKKGSSPRPGGGRKGQFEKQNEDLMYMISLGNMIAGGGVAGAATKNLIQNDPKTYRMLSDKFGQQFFEEEKAKYLADPNNRPSAPAMNPYMNPYMSLAQGAGPPKTGLALYDYQGGTYPNTGPFAGDTAGIGLPGSVGYSL